MFVTCIRESSLLSSHHNPTLPCLFVVFDARNILIESNERTSDCSGAYYSAQDGDNDLGNAFFGPTTFDNLVSSWTCVDA
jgi:hypothetical protein